MWLKTTKPWDIFFWRQTFFRHNTLNVFYHNDGVIHQQADGEHHPEHC